MLTPKKWSRQPFRRTCSYKRLQTEHQLLYTGFDPNDSSSRFDLVKITHQKPKKKIRKKRIHTRQYNKSPKSHRVYQAGHWIHKLVWKYTQSAKLECSTTITKLKECSNHVKPILNCNYSIDLTSCKPLITHQMTRIVILSEYEPFPKLRLDARTRVKSSWTSIPISS